MTEPTTATTEATTPTQPELLPGVPYNEQKAATTDAGASAPRSPTIQERATKAKQEQQDYLAAQATESKTEQPRSPVSSTSIMERAAKAKEEQKQYLANEGGGGNATDATDSTAGGKTEGKTEQAEAAPAAKRPPPPAGNWGGGGPPPKNETAKQKRDRQRREQDAARLRQSSKFGQKRPKTPNRNRPHGETTEEREAKKKAMLEAKKKQAMARFTPAQQKLLKRGKESREYWSNYAKQRPNTAQRERNKKEKQEEEEKKESGKKDSGKRGGKNEAFNMNDIWHACDRGNVKYIKNHVQHSKWDVRRHHDRGPGGFGATPLHKACWGSHVGLVKWLLEHVERRYGTNDVVWGVFFFFVYGLPGAEN